MYFQHMKNYIRACNTLITCNEIYSYIFICFLEIHLEWNIITKLPIDDDQGEVS